MRIGQTSFAVFSLKILTSILGFASTIYFARILGPEVLGYYALVITLSSWFTLGTDLGVGGALTKRISEGEEPDAYFTSGLIIASVLGIIISVGIFLFQDAVNSYLGADLAEYVILIVVVQSIGSILGSALEGNRLVHISGALSPLRTGVRSFVQILLVFVGYEIVGMVVGHVVGGVAVVIVSLIYVSSGISRPRREHFESLWNFAKFSWLGGIRGRVFNEIDIVILGIFVAPELVGIYSVAWGITNFIGVFGSSIEQTTFPELSMADAEGQREEFAAIFTDSIKYTGLFAIPGFFGALAIAERLLLIYGSKFTQGVTVLVLLMLATLFWDYYNQFLVGLNTLNRPDIAFRINAIFVLLNIGLNIALVLLFGWVGAAVATAVSAGAGVVISFLLFSRLLSFESPVGELGRQIVAALLMCTVVVGVQWGIEQTFNSIHNTTFVIGLVALGAGIYFTVLFAISPQFRSTVTDNSPITLPF